MEENFAGQIVGGWEFVWAGYAITWVALMAYGLSCYLRARAEPEPPAAAPPPEGDAP